MTSEMIEFILDQGDEGYWDWHVPSGRVDYSRRWAEMLGYDIAELEPTKDTWARLVHPDDGRRTLQALQDHWDGRTALFETSFRMRAKTGEWRWIASRGRVVSWLDEGRPERMLGINTDVDAKRKTEELLERHKGASNATSEMISVVNADFVYEEVNDAWCHLMKLNRRQAIGHTVGEIWGQRVFDEQIRPHLSACFAGRNEIYDAWLSPEPHGKRHLNVAMFPHWGLPGKVTHAIIVTRDTSNEKAAEQELVRAWRAAENAHQAKSVFLANMSHEIRTPLNAITGMSFLLKQSTLGQKQIDYVRKIDSAASNLIHIVNDILDFSRVDAEVIELEKVEFGLDDVLSNLLQLTSLQAKQKGLGLRLEVLPETPRRLVGDPLRLSQVLLSLTDNAIKFTNSGEVVVAVSKADGEASPGVRLRFEVRDTGIGISEQQIQRIFEPFSQVDASAARRYGGTGLGLAICKKFVQLMGGEIDAKSSPGRSTVFSFTAKFRTPADVMLESGKYPVHNSRRRALVVESDENSRTQLMKMLREFAFDVSGADSAERAAAEVRRAQEAGAPFGFVLIESSLPGAGWKLVAEKIRAEQSRGPRLQIALIAPEGAELQGIDPAEKTVDALLTKPVLRQALFDLLMNAVSVAGEVDQATPVPEQKTASSPAILKGARILLVEDNEVNQQIAEEILTLAGCSVTVASDGTEAVSKILNDGAQPFAAVLMDLHMPGLDGFAATRRIRSQTRFAGLPIIAMTADVIEGVREKCLDAGMNDYLTKPVRPNELYATLAVWLSPHRATQPPEQARPAAIETPAAEFVDFERALERVGNNRALYERLAQQFIEKYEFAAEEVEALVKRGETEAALRLLHTIRGVSGNMGFGAVSNAAGEWEASLRTNPLAPNVETARKHFGDTLGQTLTVIKKFFPTLSKEVAEKPKDKAVRLPGFSISPQLESLERMLKTHDMSATNLARAIGVQLKGTDLESDFAAIALRVFQLKYQDALLDLSSLKSKLQPA